MTRHFPRKRPGLWREGSYMLECFAVSSRFRVFIELLIHNMQVHLYREVYNNIVSSSRSHIKQVQKD